MRGAHGNGVTTGWACRALSSNISREKVKHYGGCGKLPSLRFAVTSKQRAISREWQELGKAEWLMGLEAMDSRRGHTLLAAEEREQEQREGDAKS